MSLDYHFFYQPEKIQKSSHKRHALRLSSVGPEPREPGSNSPEPRLQTYLRRPVPTHANARPREVRRRRDACPGPWSVRIRKPQAAGWISKGTLLSPFVSLWRFHVLFNSLFKVLFIFPSRYLFAIGLTPVFSFRWSLPPILGCIPKQPDSSKAHRGRPALPQTGLSPSATCRSKQLRQGPSA